MQTFSDLSPPGYNSPTSVVWLEQPLHKVFKPKAPPERTPFLAKNLSIFSLCVLYVIQALGWLNFVTGVNLLWLVSPKIQQSNKCCMTRTTSAQSVQARNSTRKNTLPCQESLYFFFFVYCELLQLGLGLNESIYRLNGPHEIITQFILI